MAKKILVLLLVLGIVGILSGCDLINDLLEGEVETWEWEPLNWKDGQTFTYSMEADDGEGAVVIGSMDIEITSAFGGDLKMEVSGTLGGESFSASAVGDPYDPDEFLFWFGDIIDEVENQLGENNFEFFHNLFHLLPLHEFIGAFLEEGEELFVGFSDEYIKYSPTDPDEIMISREINIPGLKTHLGEKGYLVDVVWIFGEDQTNQIWNLLISFEGPVKLKGKITFYEDNEIDRIFSIELTSYSD